MVHTTPQVGVFAGGGRHRQRHAGIRFGIAILFDPAQLAGTQAVQTAEDRARIVDQALQHVMCKGLDHRVAVSFLPKPTDHVYVETAIDQ